LTLGFVCLGQCLLVDVFGAVVLSLQKAWVAAEVMAERRSRAGECLLAGAGSNHAQEAQAGELAFVALQ